MNYTGNFTTIGCETDATIILKAATPVDAVDGGTAALDLGAGGVTLTVPGNATNDDAVYQINQIDSDEAFGNTGTPNGQTLAGSMLFEFSALTDSQTRVSEFDENISVIMLYTDEDIEGLDESSLVI